MGIKNSKINSLPSSVSKADDEKKKPLPCSVHRNGKESPKPTRTIIQKTQVPVIELDSVTVSLNPSVHEVSISQSGSTVYTDVKQPISFSEKEMETRTFVLSESKEIGDSKITSLKRQISIPSPFKSPITLIIACMKAQKTLKLIMHYQMAKHMHPNECFFIKFAKDNRWSQKLAKKLESDSPNTRVVNRDLIHIEADISVERLSESDSKIQERDAKFIFVDEGQLYPDFSKYCFQWAKEGRMVCLCFLSRFFSQFMDDLKNRLCRVVWMPMRIKTCGPKLSKYYPLQTISKNPLGVTFVKIKRPLYRIVKRSKR